MRTEAGLIQRLVAVFVECLPHGSTPRAAPLVPPDNLSLEEASWLFSSFCLLHRVSFQPALFAQRYPAPVSRTMMQGAAAELGLECEFRSCGIETALAWKLPLAVWLHPAETADAASSALALLLNADEERVVLLERGVEAPAMVQMHDLQQRYRGAACACWPQLSEAHDPDGIERNDSRFGLRWFVPELLRHKRVWRDVLAGSLALQLMALTLPLFTQVIIDKVVVHRTHSTLIALGIAMAVFLVFNGLLSWVRQYLILHTGQRIDAMLAARVFDKLFRLPLGYFQRRPTGVISARLQGIEAVREFITSAGVSVALDLPFLLIFIGIMFWYSVPLTLLVLAIVSLVSALNLLVAPVFRERLNRQFCCGAANQAFLTEYIAGIETVKSLQFEPQLGQRYRNLMAQYLSSGFATRQLANTCNVIASGLEQLMSTSILLVGAWIVISTHALTIGMLVAFQMFAARVSQPMLRMVGLWQQWQQTRIAVARLGDIMNAPSEAYSLKPRRAPRSAAGCIDVEGLAFRYSEHLPWLYQDFSFSLRSGELIVLTGPSGSGKSTFAGLLQGFHAPTRGRIRVDGVDTGHLSANELRSSFGVVPQDTVLFSGTLSDNLKLANPAASFEQIVAACQMAEIHSTIESLPGGYETEIGERGAGLSGGQRQRLSIARALLKGPKVLIFDEATASLDTATAEQIGRTISSLRGRVSMLFIAHSLPRSLQVDQFVRIGDKLSVVSVETPGMWARP
ncbi:MAG: peptidase domain-containing ABC transporter [Pseudomonadales bacterium]|nr:peptidase domain-containing ABC transporter [Pseudomonadales bacterium]